MGKKYESVSEMVKDTLPEEFAKKFDDELAKRSLAKAFALTRVSLGYSVKQMAEYLGCTKKKIRQLERSKDCDIKPKWIERYKEVLQGLPAPSQKCDNTTKIL